MRRRQTDRAGIATGIGPRHDFAGLDDAPRRVIVIERQQLSQLGGHVVVEADRHQVLDRVPSSLTIPTPAMRACVMSRAATATCRSSAAGSRSAIRRCDCSSSSASAPFTRVEKRARSVLLAAGCIRHLRGVIAARTAVRRDR